MQQGGQHWLPVVVSQTVLYVVAEVMSRAAERRPRSERDGVLEKAVWPVD